MRILITLSIFLLPLFALPFLSIDDTFVSKKSSGYLGVVSDPSSSITKEEILKLDLEPISKDHLGTKKNPHWSKLLLKNSSLTPKELYLYNPMAGINTIDVYIYKENQLIQTHSLGDLTSQNKREYLRYTSLFKLNLLPNEDITIITRVENYGFYHMGWTLTLIKEYERFEFILDILYAFLGGFAFFYFFYVLFLYHSHKKIGYLILSTQIIFALLYVYSAYGLFYKLDIGINLHFITTLAWLTPILTALTLLSFPYYFFKTKIKYPKIAKLLEILFGIFLVFGLATLYGVFVDDRFFAYYNLFSPLYLFNYIVVFAIAVYMFFQNEIGKRYYLYGQGSLMLLAIIHTLAIFGHIHYEGYTHFLIPLALIIDSTFMLISQYTQGKYEHDRISKQKEILLEQSRFYSIGEAVGNIAHQWKHPLTLSGSIATLLEITLKENPSKLHKVTENSIPDLQFAIKQMRNILDEFSGLYKTYQIATPYSPKKLLKQILSTLLASKITLKNAQIDVDIRDDLVINSHDHLFVNIMMILIDNSLDEFMPKGNNHISIKIYQSDKHIIIEHTDNAGGIKIEPIEQIFEYLVTTKPHKENHGFGLPIAKILIEERLRGTITASNTEDGAKFVVLIPL